MLVTQHFDSESWPYRVEYVSPEGTVAILKRLRPPTDKVSNLRGEGEFPLWFYEADGNEDVAMETICDESGRETMDIPVMHMARIQVDGSYKIHPGTPPLTLGVGKFMVDALL
jgi:hypothetical protein